MLVIYYVLNMTLVFTVHRTVRVWTLPPRLEFTLKGHLDEIEVMSPITHYRAAHLQASNTISHVVFKTIFVAIREIPDHATFREKENTLGVG